MVCDGVGVGAGGLDGGVGVGFADVGVGVGAECELGAGFGAELLAAADGLLLPGALAPPLAGFLALVLDGDGLALGDAPPLGVPPGLAAGVLPVDEVVVVPEAAA